MANRLEIEKQNSQTVRVMRTEIAIRIILFFLTGIVTGFLGAFVEVAIDSFRHFNVNQDLVNTLGGFIMTRFIGVFFPIFIGVSLAIITTPYAAGGGVAQAIGYLNGIKVSNFLDIKSLMVKTISTICSCVSGLATGMGEPMLYMGTAIGGSLPSAFPWLQFKLDHERIDFAAAGFGAGLAAVFGAPIGGLLFALEDGVRFLQISLMWKIYLCCVTSYFVKSVLMSLIYGVTIKLNKPDLLSLRTPSSDITDYEWFEVVPFALLGVIGGLIGVMLIKIHVHVTLFRNRHIHTRFRKLIAALVAACFVTMLQVSAILFLKTCSNIPSEPAQHPGLFKTHNSTNLYQLHCSDGKRSDMYVMISQTQGSVMRLLFSEDLMHMSSLAVYSIMYFIFLCLTDMALPMNACFFIPQIIFGASWGRLFGTFLNAQVNHAIWARPAKYAYLGAAAQLSGTIGKTFSILVIFVEASDSGSLAFPLMVVVSISRVVRNYFTVPMYEAQMFLMGLPFLPYRPPPFSCNITVTKKMSQPPLVTLPSSPTVSAIIDTLQNNIHNGFPIVETENTGKVLIGLILREQLLILLKQKAYRHPRPTTQQKIIHCLNTFMEDSSKELNVRDIIDGVEKKYYDVKVDLSLYYNRHPHTVIEHLPLIKAYEYFYSLGLRHLVVITKSYEPIGMITRRDLARYNSIETRCKLKVT